MRRFGHAARRLGTRAPARAPPVAWPAWTGESHPLSEGGGGGGGGSGVPVE